MQTEIEKRIEEYISKLGMTHDRNNNPNVISPSSIKLGAKFILELPELDEIVFFIKFATIENASRREVSFHAKKLLEALKKAGLV